MRLKRLHIRGFGQLRGEVLLESGAGTVSLLLERNEAGKSTLAAAIVAALYGLETDRRRARGAKVARDLYRPWAGGAFGLSMTLEAGGREIVVDRDFERSSVRVFEGSTDITDRFQRGSRIAVGEVLTGLSREQFLLSAFVGQGDIVWSDAGSLTEALQRVADSQGGKATAAAAVEALDHALTHYDGVTLAGPGRVETEIERCRQVIETSAAKLAELDRTHDEFREKIEELSRDELREHNFSWQMEVLRARRLRSEANALEEVLNQDQEVQRRVRATEEELEEIGDLDRFEAAELRSLEEDRRRYEDSLRDLQRETEACDRSGEARAEAVALRDALGFLRRPTEEDANVLWQASVRHEDADRELSRLETRLADQERELATRGVQVDRAQELAERFDDLHEEDRVRLGGRTQEMLRLEERRAATDEREAVERQCEAELLRARVSLRRSGWVLTVVAVALAGSILLFASQLPLSVMVTRAVAGALLVVGPALVLVASRRGSTELSECRARIRQIEEAQLQITEDEAELQGRWEDLARRLQIDASQLEAQYREYRTVEVAARSIASLRARVRDLDRAQVRAQQEASGVAEIFPPRDRDRSLGELLSLLRHAMRCYEEADRATAIADASRQRLETFKNVSRQLESVLRNRLRSAGLDISATDSIDAAFERLHREVEVLRRARQLRDETLPTLRRQLLEARAREEHQHHLETIRSEGLRLRASIEAHLREAGADTSQLDEMLAVPLSQSQFDEDLQRLKIREDQARSSREAERTEVRAFLRHYESEAPTLRSTLEGHQRALRRAEEFRAAVSFARDALEEIGRETHRTWAAALNRHCNEVLRGLNSRAQRLTFGEDLSLRLEQEGQQLTGADAVQHLSAGALDAIYLSARIAVSRFLSGGEETLPLILDDPFANADDPRLVAGLRMLLEQIAPHQQVLLMACQRSRYRWLHSELGRPPELVALEVTAHSGNAMERGDDDTHHAQA